jgi:hypothetical protein
VKISFEVKKLSKLKKKLHRGNVLDLFYQTLKTMSITYLVWDSLGEGGKWAWG